MVGKIHNDEQFPVLVNVIRKYGLEQDVVMPGFVPEGDLLQLYKLSSVFCFLSLYEGFGLPPLEAMATGTPVVSSDRSAMPEVLGDSACMVDPEDARLVARKLEHILEDQSYAAELSAKGKRQAARFTWENTGKLTFAGYEKAAGFADLG